MWQLGGVVATALAAVALGDRHGTAASVACVVRRQANISHAHLR